MTNRESRAKLPFTPYVQPNLQERSRLQFLGASSPFPGFAGSALPNSGPHEKFNILTVAASSNTSPTSVACGFSTKSEGARLGRTSRQKE